MPQRARAASVSPRWQIKKEITVGNMISAGAMLTMMLAAWFTLRGQVEELGRASVDQSRRLTVIETAVPQMKTDLQVLRGAVENQSHQFETQGRQIERIGDKIDRLTESSHGAPRK